MLLLDQEATRQALPWRPLIDGIQDMFVSGCEMPLRHHHDFDIPDEPSGTLLLMPAWVPGEFMGIKMVTVVPGNTTRALPAICGTYLISNARTGEVLAQMDGAELTARRTAAASALAASYLAKKEAKNHLIVGAGKLALNLVEAHAQTRDIQRVEIWARKPEKAQALVDEARALGHNALVAKSLEDGVRNADIISCCTLSTDPLVLGEWLKPGAHLDLIGAFKPDMRETDDEAVRKASLFADTIDGVLSEGGDIVQPIRDGVIEKDQILADLFQLCRGEHVGRQSDDEITLFKSVGAALEDLAAAKIAYLAVSQ